MEKQKKACGADVHNADDITRNTIGHLPASLLISHGN
jgi:hypothetical protein